MWMDGGRDWGRISGTSGPIAIPSPDAFCYDYFTVIAQTYTYTVVLEPDDEAGGFVVHVPALPGCHTEADSREAAVAMAQDAVTGYVESLVAHN
jgi:predicted RNase H-like HicB family nuclease